MARFGGGWNFLNPSFQIEGYHKINLKLGKAFLPIDLHPSFCLLTLGDCFSILFNIS